MLDLSILPYILPEFLIVMAVLLVTLIGSFSNKISYRFYPFMAILVLVLAFISLLINYHSGRAIIFNKLFIYSAYTSFAKMIVLIASIFCILLSLGYTKIDKSLESFEYYIILLLSVLGMMVMISSNDLMSLYLGLELLSLSLYSMVSFNRTSLFSSESGLKYFILGALASGILLYGMSLIYGFTGATNFSALEDVYAKYVSGASIPIGVSIGILFVICGFLFKLAAVPFHMWAPDVYQGSSLPVTVFLSTAPKAASMFVLIKLILLDFNVANNLGMPVIAVVSSLSMCVGAIGGLFQTNIKKLLAYSSISHIGFIMVGLVSSTISGAEASIIYLCIYLVMNLGVFAFVAILQSSRVEDFNIMIFTGLSKTNPVMSFSISVLLLSMAGIPPLAGFLAKFYVIYGAISDGFYFLALISMLSAVISTFYYLKIIKLMYFDNSEISIFDKLFSVENLIIASFATIFNVILILFPTTFNKIVDYPVRSLFE